MSLYTLTLKEIMESLQPNEELFDFDYPFYDDEERLNFQTKFVAHFYFREIGSETLGRFKFYLRERLNLIMPYYNKFYTSMNLEQRILNNYDMTEDLTRTTGDKRMFSDTPQGSVSLTALSGRIHLTELNDDTGSEEYTRRTVGNMGVQTDAQAVAVYQDAQRNIDLMVFLECNDLFMQIY